VPLLCITLIRWQRDSFTLGIRIQNDLRVGKDCTRRSLCFWTYQLSCTGSTGKLRDCRGTYMLDEAIALKFAMLYDQIDEFLLVNKSFYTQRSTLVHDLFALNWYHWKESALRAATLQRRMRLPQFSNVISRNGSSVLTNRLYTH
jgi:hypothetical protein